MNHRSEWAEAGNPFSASRIRPGTMPFIFPAGESVSTLLDRLQKHQWWGQVIGPHGSGKSTLLTQLRAALKQSGRGVWAVELHDGQRRLPKWPQSLGHLDPPHVLVVDGYEQLSRWNRWRLSAVCRRRGHGLVVTAHQSVGLPDLLHTTVDVDLAIQVVQWLQNGCPQRIDPQDVAQCLTRQQGNLRETLFDLYDLYQQRG